MKVTLKVSQTVTQINFTPEDVGSNQEEWKTLSEDQKETLIEEYWNDHRDSVVYWSVEPGTIKST